MIRAARYKTNLPSMSLASSAMLTLSVVSALLTHSGHALADTSPHDAALSPVGVWVSVDDTTLKPKALIDIKQMPNGELSGYILTGLGANHNPTKRCSACTDDRKGHLMQGLNIIRHVTQNGDVWENGKILDPENGKDYHVRMNLTDQGQKLVVRGYIGIPLIGRSQTWLRDPHPETARAAAAADTQANAKANAESQGQTETP